MSEVTDHIAWAKVPSINYNDTSRLRTLGNPKCELSFYYIDLQMQVCIMMRVKDVNGIVREGYGQAPRFEVALSNAISSVEKQIIMAAIPPK
jgi:hypothetical protein